MRIITVDLIVSLILVLATISDGESLFPKSVPWWETEREHGSTCKSSCTQYSKGSKIKIELCDDRNVCKGSKKTIEDFAKETCTKWSQNITDLIPEMGKREKHQPAKGNWLACAIFCRSKAGYWINPRSKLKERGLSPFFPDGIWCHRNANGENYYCRKSLCLPENYDFAELRTIPYDYNEGNDADDEIIYD